MESSDAQQTVVPTVTLDFNFDDKYHTYFKKYPMKGALLPLLEELSGKEEALFMQTLEANPEAWNLEGDISQVRALAEKMAKEVHS